MLEVIVKIILEYRENKKDVVSIEEAGRVIMARLEFDSEQWEFDEALKAIHGSHYHSIIEDIWQSIFRPNFKHGYNDTLLDSDLAYKIIKKLSDRYNDLLEQRNYHSLS